MALSDIIEDVTAELPLDNPVTIVGNTDPQVRQLLRIANAQGRELVMVQEWNTLITRFQFEITSDPHFEPFPQARQRSLQKAKVWRRDSLTPLVGPINSSQWTFFLTFLAGFFPGYWRNFGGGINIIGVGTGAMIDTEYLSNAWVSNAAGTEFFTRFQADTDLVRFDEEVMTLGIIWRWKQRKGLDYAEDMQTYERQKELYMAADRDAKPFSYSRRFVGADIESANAGQVSVILD